MNWPSFGTPYPYNQGTIPALENFNAGYYTSCTVNPATSIHDASDIHGFEIYPNPVQDKLFLNYENSKPIYVEVYNELGIICLTKEITNKESIDISTLSPGIYFLKVGERAVKFIKENK